MTIQNGNDADVHILCPTDNGIRHAKLIEVRHPNISLHLHITRRDIYTIPKLPPKRIMVNLLLHQCCEV